MKNEVFERPNLLVKKLLANMDEVIGTGLTSQSWSMRAIRRCHWWPTVYKW